MLRQWCSLSILHRTCKNMHRGVGLGRLSKPNGCCTLHMPIYFKPWGIKKYSVPYMVQTEFTYISIKCGIVNPCIYGFLNCSGNVMVLPSSLLFGSCLAVVMWPVVQLWLCMEEGTFRCPLMLMFLIVLLSLEWICIPYLLQTFLMLLHRPWVKVW